MPNWFDWPSFWTGVVSCFFAMIFVAMAFSSGKPPICSSLKVLYERKIPFTQKQIDLFDVCQILDDYKK